MSNEKNDAWLYRQNIKTLTHQIEEIEAKIQKRMKNIEQLKKEANFYPS